jgi:hypothetical protein
MTTLPYIGSVINIANSFSQATRPKHVGQMSELIQQFRNSNYEHSVKGWQQYYNDKIGEDKIEIASHKIWDYVQRIKENLGSLTEEDVYEWTHDLIINKTFLGLDIQLSVLKMASNNKPYRLSTSEEESKGIDGFIDNEPVSIKPYSYKKTFQQGTENIEYKIVYYKNTKNGIVII